jgi:microcin C transport system ATP-binding protein
MKILSVIYLRYVNPVTATTLLSIEHLSVVFGRYGTQSEVVHNISFNIAYGEKLALVGESGSGKSVTALSVLRLHDRDQVHYPSGQIMFQGQDLLRCSEARLRQVRGKDIAMIFQEPMTSLNPVYPIGTQLLETLLLHEHISKAAAKKRMLDLLERTGITEPHKRFDAFPHMLSGGQRQRVMIAMALACQPQLLIADEPTTALDVTIQLQILELLEEMQQEFGMAVLLITHDLNIVRRFAQRVCVMQNGHLVEHNTVDGLFAAPRHPYTLHLLNSRPSPMPADAPQPHYDRLPLLQGKKIECGFALKSGLWRRQVGWVKAVDDADIEIYPGETVGIVGESGSGKTTLGMCLLKLQACQGAIFFDGIRLDTLKNKQLRPLRKEFQVVFQDPYSSLSPRMNVEQIVGEGLHIHFPHLNKTQRRTRIVTMLEEVGLEEAMLWRYPHEFSGGQRQRIAIARAVILEPKLMLLDEPTSALDVSVQKQVLELLRDLQQRHHMSYLFISHDLGVIRAMAHRIIVMRHGRFIEHGPTAQLFHAPQAEYTRQLLHASLFSVTARGDK